MVIEHLLCAGNFGVIVTTIAGNATIVPILEIKKLRLREHSRFPRTPGYVVSDQSLILRPQVSQLLFLPPEQNRNSPWCTLCLSPSSRLPGDGRRRCRDHGPTSLHLAASTP